MRPQQLNMSQRLAAQAHQIPAAAGASEGKGGHQAGTAQRSVNTAHADLQADAEATTREPLAGRQASDSLRALTGSPGLPGLALPAHDASRREGSPGEAAVQQALAVAGCIAEDLVPDSAEEVRDRHILLQECTRGDTAL